MIRDTHPTLSAQTFASWHWHLLEAPELYFRPGGDPKLTTESAEEEAKRLRANEAELQTLRCESTDGYAPLWLAIPVQTLACAAWLMFIVVLVACAVALTPFYLAGEGVSAIVRGLRWALC